MHSIRRYIFRTDEAIN